MIGLSGLSQRITAASSILKAGPYPLVEGVYLEDIDVISTRIKQLDIVVWIRVVADGEKTCAAAKITQEMCNLETLKEIVLKVLEEAIDVD